MKENIINNEIEQVLQSGSHKEEINTSPFFTTRVMGRIEQLDEVQIGRSRFSLLLKPALFLIMIINLANYYLFNSSGDNKVTKEDEIEYIVNNSYSYATNDFIYSEELLSNNKK